MGKVIMSGSTPKLSKPVIPPKGILARNLAVGSSVYINVNGTPKEFLVVNQGIPGGSSVYDASCDGVWLLMKDIHTTSQVWGKKDQYNENAVINRYNDSVINTYLNSTFLNMLDADFVSLIKYVKIPYINRNTMLEMTGSEGLGVHVFLLSAREVGLSYPATYVNWETYETRPYNDSACLSYFSGTSETDSKRIARMNGTAYDWATRSMDPGSISSIYVVSNSGGYKYVTCANGYGTRPALILPYDTLFDEETMMVKGA